MNIYEQEVRNRSSQKVLDAMKRNFQQGFVIVGSDADTFTVGDGTKNVSYSRNSGKILSTHSFSSTQKLSRK
jgi:hypothetical protein